MEKGEVKQSHVEDLSPFRERRRYLHKINPKLASFYDIFMCISVRLVLIIECVFCIYYLVSSTGIYLYLILVIFLVAIVVDTVAVIANRNGQEWFW
jgi:hypothetical protein